MRGVMCAVVVFSVWVSAAYGYAGYSGPWCVPTLYVGDYGLGTYGFSGSYYGSAFYAGYGGVPWSASFVNTLGGYNTSSDSINPSSSPQTLRGYFVSGDTNGYVAESSGKLAGIEFGSYNPWPDEEPRLRDHHNSKQQGAATVVQGCHHYTQGGVRWETCSQY